MSVQRASANGEFFQGTRTEKGYPDLLAFQFVLPSPEAQCSAVQTKEPSKCNIEAVLVVLEGIEDSAMGLTLLFRLVGLLHLTLPVGRKRRSVPVFLSNQQIDTASETNLPG